MPPSVTEPDVTNTADQHISDSHASDATVPYTSETYTSEPNATEAPMNDATNKRYREDRQQPSTPIPQAAPVTPPLATASSTTTLEQQLQATIPMNATAQWVAVPTATYVTLFDLVLQQTDLNTKDLAYYQNRNYNNKGNSMEALAPYLLLDNENLLLWSMADALYTATASSRSLLLLPPGDPIQFSH